MFANLAHYIEGHPLAILLIMALPAALTAGAGFVISRYRAAARRMAETAHLRCLADAAVEGLLILDGPRAIEANHAFLKMAGYCGEVLQPGPATDYFPDFDFARLTTNVGAAPIEALLANPRGRDRLVELRLRAVTWNGQPRHALAVSDITEQRETDSRMTELAYQDALTGLPNRCRFPEDRAAAIDPARAGERIAVLIADLDGFRALNAAHGETVGDSILLQAGQRIRKVTREDDLAARIGGDEFGMIQYGGTEAAHAFMLAARIQAALDKPLRAGPGQVRLGCSAGIAFYPDDGADPAELIRRAAQALTYAKAAGRAVRRYEPRMDQAMRERRQLAADLRHAIARGQLGLHFQPVADAATGRITGFEALCRWDHPKLGPVSPAIFVPLAEDIGFMPMLGKWVLHQAAAEAARWAMPVTLSVNISPVQFADGDLAESVASILAETGLAPDRLDLGVTEAIFTGDNAAALAALHRIKAQGASISLDDFGTGASSLNSLRLFPFERLKISPCFNREIAVNAEARAIVRSVIGLGHALGMKVIAEGVDDDAQLDTLRAEGCDLVQGHAVSRSRADGAGSFTLVPAAPKSTDRELQAA